MLSFRLRSNAAHAIFSLAFAHAVDSKIQINGRGKLIDGPALDTSMPVLPPCNKDVLLYAESKI